MWCYVFGIINTVVLPVILHFFLHLCILIHVKIISLLIIIHKRSGDMYQVCSKWPHQNNHISYLSVNFISFVA